jgi:release factor glutamine methyltransferase
VIDQFAGKTVEEARRALAANLKSGGITSAELDARLLLGDVLGLDLTGMIVAGGQRLRSGEAQRVEEFMQRRLDGEPVARILGVKEFWGLPLQLSAATLVPRPDTETVVEFALEISAGEHGGQPRRILDIGTGSGAILLALLSEWREASGVGTDISPAALKTARHNAARLGFASRAMFVACNYTAALSGTFDLIVSNPPYVCSADIAELDREVRNFDPRHALDGGVDGLDAYREIIVESARLLAPGGTLIVEAGSGQSGLISQMMAVVSGLTAVRPPKADLAGIPRAVAGRKRPDKA